MDEGLKDFLKKRMDDKEGITTPPTPPPEEQHVTNRKSFWYATWLLAILIFICGCIAIGWFNATTQQGLLILAASIVVAIFAVVLKRNHTDG